MEKSCDNCKFYEPVKRRGQKYPKGACGQHYAYRIHDGWQNKLFIFTPDEFVCDLHEPAPQSVFAMVDNEPVRVSPAMVSDLIKQGWVLMKLDGSQKIVSKDEVEE
jgi:hypothetical protein